MKYKYNIVLDSYMELATQLGLCAQVVRSNREGHNKVKRLAKYTKLY